MWQAVLVVALAAQVGASAQGPGDAARGSRAPSSLRVLVVPAPDAPPGRVEEIYGALRTVGLTTVGLSERAGVDLAVDGSSPPPGRVDAAREAYLRARAHYKNLQMDEVGPALAEALDVILRLDAPHAARDLLADVLLLRAEVALVSGREADAHDDLLLLCRVDRGRAPLNPGLYPPSLVEAYARAVESDAAMPTGLVSLLPRVALGRRPEVLLDGAHVEGASFQTLRPKVGPHLLTVRADGVATFTRVIRVDERQPIDLEPFLAPSGADLERRDLVEQLRAGDAQPDALARLAALSAAGALLLVHDDEPRVFVPGRPVAALGLPADAPAFDLARRTVAALRAPLLEEEGLDPRPLLVGAGVAGVVVSALAVAGVGLAVLAWAPFETPSDPPRPVAPSCCN